ncbi:hypothetical protein HAX54_053101 [Datura stramonium]|uniref:Uncharacterized protein n=1 Tax=Datura stramonium TaxID=4076 RepID=A0ABS8RRU4_DATST|nr:hypothetical protein [Datura stramonium]
MNCKIISVGKLLPRVARTKAQESLRDGDSIVMLTYCCYALIVACSCCFRSWHCTGITVLWPMGRADKDHTWSSTARKEQWRLEQSEALPCPDGQRLQPLFY